MGPAFFLPATTGELIMATSPKSKDSIASIGPADSYSAVTPNDSTVVQARALWIGTGGNVAVKATNGAPSVTFTNVPDGTLMPIMAYQGMNTNTTASNIVALF